MRKKLFTLLLAMMASIGSLFAESGTCGENLTWDLTDGILTISGIGGMTDYSYYTSAPWYSNRSAILSVAINDGVTSIGEYAFYGCSSLTSVTIPNSVTSIGDNAFYGCSSLTSMMIPNSVTSIGWGAFNGCTGLTSPLYNDHVFAYLPASYSGAYTIPDGIESIAGFAFIDCSGLTSVTIPNSVTSIGEKSFMYCTGLTSVTIPSSVTSIGESAFEGCSSLTSVTIPNSVTSIGGSAFSGCSGLTSVTIGNSVTSIGDGAFYGCSSLPVIDNIRYADTYLVGAIDKEQSTYSIQAGTKWIGSAAFYSCSSLTSINIPNSITSIGYSAFKGCSSLTSINIPNNVTSIGSSAFSGCSSLTSITIPENVLDMGNNTFSGCSNLISVIWNAKNCKDFSYTDGQYSAFIYAPFYGIKTQLTSFVFGNKVEHIPSNLCYEMSNLKSIKMPESLKSIGKEAFRNCNGLTSITIGKNVTDIEYGAFSGCENLTSVTIPSSVTSIGEDAFMYCTGLISVTIGNSVTNIGRSAFLDCSSLTSVTIGNSVTSIGNSAFSRCSSLTSIYMYPTTPPTIDKYTFYNINDNAILYAPMGCLQVYKSAKYETGKKVGRYDSFTSMNIQGPIISQNIVTSATSSTIIFDADYALIQSVGVEGGEQQAGNTLEYIGLEPNSEYKDFSIILTPVVGLPETVNVSFTTTALTLTTKPSKAVSATTAILLAETNMSDAEINCGFEYKRNDAPDDMAGTKVFCPVASGQMAGRLKNLKDDVYYKYRAFYQSSAGNMYYGDWQYIFTGDVAVEFDPILYTYGATVVKENEATISGYALAGSEDFTEQGFEYWAESRTNNGTNAPRRMPEALNEHFFVQASGISLRVTLTNLDAGTVYKYRVYGKVGDQYYYGSEQTFTTTGTYTPPTYTITFANWDGTELQSSQVTEGEMPEYTGATPVRPEDEQNTYSFNGWSPAIVAATADATYTATYAGTPKSQGIEDVQGDKVQCTKVLRDGQIFIFRGDKTYTLQGQEVR